MEAQVRETKSQLIAGAASRAKLAEELASTRMQLSAAEFALARERDEAKVLREAAKSLF